MGKYCNQCQKIFTDNTKFCPNCGVELTYCDDEEYRKNIDNTTYRYRESKEKVKFSHQFLIPKLILIGAFNVSCVRNTIDTGVVLALTGEGWIGLIAWFLTSAFFSSWFMRNILNYSGSEYLITFGIEKHYFSKIENCLKSIRKVISCIFYIIFAICYIRRFISALFSFGLISFSILYVPMLLALADVKSLLIIWEIIEKLHGISGVYRPITKKDFEKLDEEMEINKCFEYVLEKIEQVWIHKGNQ